MLFGLPVYLCVNLESRICQSQGRNFTMRNSFSGVGGAPMGSRGDTKEFRPRSVLVLDANGALMGEVSFAKAVRAVVSGRAVVLDPRQWTRLDSLPVSIYLISVILFPQAHAKGKIKLLGKGKRVILRRDGFRCQYCGKHASTIDHVQPRCQGGPTSYINLVAACLVCNNAKSGRTPEQAGMTLLRPVPSPRQILEERLALACNM